MVTPYGPSPANRAKNESGRPSLKPGQRPSGATGAGRLAPRPVGAPAGRNKPPGHELQQKPENLVVQTDAFYPPKPKRPRPRVCRRNPARPKCAARMTTTAITGGRATKPGLRRLTHPGRLPSPEGRAGPWVCPGLRHARLKPQRAATNRRGATNYNKSRKTAWRKWIGCLTPTKTTRPRPA